MGSIYSVEETNPSNLLSVPQEILVNEILPKLSISELNKLCSSNKILVEICRNETLWENKLNLDYPDFVLKKPPQVTYLDYYKILYNYPNIPIYYHGDIIRNILFYQYNLKFLDEEIINFTKTHLNTQELPYIIYMENTFKIIAIYSSGYEFIFEEKLIPHISYISIIFPKDTEEAEEYAEIFSKRIKEDKLIDGRSLLLSNNSKIPIYGYEENNIFDILWTNASLFEYMRGPPQSCESLRNDMYMSYIYYYLDIPLLNISIPSDNEILDVLGPIYEVWFVKEFPRDKLEYLYKYWILKTNNDPLLCNKVKDALKKIGHYFKLD